MRTENSHESHYGGEGRPDGPLARPQWGIGINKKRQKGKKLDITQPVAGDV